MKIVQNLKVGNFFLTANIEWNRPEGETTPVCLFFYSDFCKETLALYKDIDPAADEKNDRANTN